MEFHQEVYMEQLNIQTLIGAAILLGCAVYALRACCQILWSGTKLGIAVMVGFMVLDLTMPTMKPYMSVSTSGRIESVLRDVRTYAELAATTANQHVVAKHLPELAGR